MRATGRNDSCPCGSGKKYKKCCQLVDEEVQRREHTQVNLIVSLMNHLPGLLKPEALEDAWREFTGDDEVDPIGDDDPMRQLFYPWFLFGWTFIPSNYVLNYEKGELPPELRDEDEDDDLNEALVKIGLIHLAAINEDLTPDEKEFLGAAIQSTYTICRVLDVRPGQGARIYDLFCQREFDVREEGVDESLEPGALLYCAPLTIDGIVSFLAVGLFPAGAEHEAEVLAVRKSILDELGQSSFTNDELIEFEPEIRFLYFDLLDADYGDDEVDQIPVN